MNVLSEYAFDDDRLERQANLRTTIVWEIQICHHNKFMLLHTDTYIEAIWSMENTTEHKMNVGKMA